MGRKIKIQMVLLAAVLLVIYGKQEIFAQGKGEAEDAGTNIERQSDQAQPNPDQPEPEPIQRYQIEEREIDGQNGYYVSIPTVRILHVSKRGVTKYSFLTGEGNQIEGVLSKAGEEVTLAAECFCEGSNILEVWMEAEALEGESEGPDTLEVPGSREHREYLVDLTGPVIQAVAPRGFDYWYDGEVALSVSAEDGGSGCMGISACQGEECIADITGAQGIVSVRGMSTGGNAIEVVFSAKDGAGNRTSLVKKLYIDQSAPKVDILGAADYLITSQTVQAECQVQEENILEEFWSAVSWESVDGQKMVFPDKGWEELEGTHRAVHTLDQEGRYQISVYARDKAGHETRQNLQIIVDKNYPVIAMVDELNGTYVREFQWDYEAGEIIRDYTTYTCAVELDGMMYAFGEKITREGSHQLKVQAVDAAGNSAQAQANFIVDRTMPEIILTGAENGRAYEEEQKVGIHLADSRDQIQEIKINGKRQKLNTNRKKYTYTMKEHQEYDIQVTARDRAGNESSRQLIFEVVEKPTLIEEIIHPVREAMGMEKNTFQKEGKGADGKAQTDMKGKWSTVTVVMVMIGGLVLYMSIRYIRRRKTLQE